MPAGLPDVALFFAASAASATVSAWAIRHVTLRSPAPILVSAAVLTGLALHELSFFVRPTREWIRVDLLLTIPLACLIDLAVGLVCVRSGVRPAKLAGVVLVACSLFGAVLLWPAAR